MHMLRSNQRSHMYRSNIHWAPTETTSRAAPRRHMNDRRDSCCQVCRRPDSVCQICHVSYIGTRV
ncbi:uncharacterized protein CC84DRAFT_429571 [Paraphaeosphaeria sporulosa]|uniref:Uncharacterized protein n=1 Tax=Paraphaeosphaeria sporulosa TaxID=1460663 RepID=A0A177BTT8_9PLEO|nr:uncharacterized protein CC84DRAFT_429571 [Paraphaeosphaeria sporulosa]OAF98674.1 hypothetical protein CC84DRAFT_429571 [Paraphaeosphaeria sporulosa]